MQMKLILQLVKNSHARIGDPNINVPVSLAITYRSKKTCGVINRIIKHLREAILTNINNIFWNVLDMRQNFPLPDGVF